MQFYYMDKFLLAGHGNRLYLLKYCLDTKGGTCHGCWGRPFEGGGCSRASALRPAAGAVDDVKRYVNRSRYQQVVSLPHAGAQSVTAMAAVNGFYSHLVLSAGSDRSLAVADMNRCQVVRHTPGAQNRPVHAIVINQGSPFTALTEGPILVAGLPASPHPGVPGAPPPELTACWVSGRGPQPLLHCRCGRRRGDVGFANPAGNAALWRSRGTSEHSRHCCESLWPVPWCRCGGPLGVYLRRPVRGHCGGRREDHGGNL